MAGYGDGGAPDNQQVSAGGDTPGAGHDPDVLPASSAESSGQDGTGPGASGVQVGSRNVQVNNFFYGSSPSAGVGMPLMPASGTADSSREGHAFISYVREDSAAVGELQHLLEEAGIRVWRDTASLWVGEDWRVKIREAITRDALVFIACFSSQSVARRKTYMNEELRLAVEQLRLRQPHDSWLIPVRLDDCPVPEFELGPGRTLESLHRADFFGASRDQEGKRLVRAVKRLLGEQAWLPTGTVETEGLPSRAVPKVPTVRQERERISEAGNPVVAAASRPYLHGSPGSADGSRGMSSLPASGTVSSGQLLVATESLRGHSMRIWDAVTGEKRATIKEHRDSVEGTAFSPDGTLLATGSHDQTARIWDVATGAVRATLTGHRGVVWRLCSHRTAPCWPQSAWMNQPYGSGIPQPALPAPR
jgi:TIR domain/WD domain, G-beta repeat